MASDRRLVGSVFQRHRPGAPGSRRRDSRSSRQDRPIDGGTRFFVRRAQTMSREERKSMIAPDLPDLSVSHQCRLVSISRSSFYYAPRHVLSWRLSNTMDTGFCVETLNEALARCGRPKIFNTDQGQPIHQRGLHRRARKCGHRDLDGRARPLDGQRLHRAAVAFAEIRVRLSQRSRDRRREAAFLPSRR